MQTIVVYQINADELKSAVADMAREQILKIYAAVKVSTQTVCEIWSISSHTLTRYINQGIIEIVGKDGKFNLFSLADVLLNNPKYKRYT